MPVDILQGHCNLLFSSSFPCYQVQSRVKVLAAGIVVSPWFLFIRVRELDFNDDIPNYDH